MEEILKSCKKNNLITLFCFLPLLLFGQSKESNLEYDLVILDSAVYDFIYSRYNSSGNVEFGDLDIVITMVGQNSSLTHYSFKDTIISILKMDYNIDTMIIVERTSKTINPDTIIPLFIEEGNFMLIPHSLNSHGSDKGVYVFRDGLLISQVYYTCATGALLSVPDFTKLKWINEFFFNLNRLI